jgi:predicted secreted protein
MSVTMGIALYFIIWWTMLFAVLPFAGRSQADAGEIVQGTPEGAPQSIRPGWVATRTTLVATVVFALVWLAVRYRLVPLDLVGRPGG